MCLKLPECHPLHFVAAGMGDECCHVLLVSMLPSFHQTCVCRICLGWHAQTRRLGACHSRDNATHAPIVLARPSFIKHMHVLPCLTCERVDEVAPDVCVPHLSWLARPNPASRGVSFSRQCDACTNCAS
jgi:hypothetical protein